GRDLLGHVHRRDQGGDGGGDRPRRPAGGGRGLHARAHQRPARDRVRADQLEDVRRGVPRHPRGDEADLPPRLEGRVRPGRAEAERPGYRECI
ncbi:MAG: hypothetical protein AVDCRST_MAG64-3851, partial [uncultured Phycisphaerae bacterium]